MGTMTISSEAPRAMDAGHPLARYVEDVYVDGVLTKNVLSYDMDAGSAQVLTMPRPGSGDGAYPTHTVHGVITVDWAPPQGQSDPSQP